MTRTRVALAFTVAAATSAAVALAASTSRDRVEPVAAPVPPAGRVARAGLDVHDPAKTFHALGENAWLRRVRAHPLGDGFLGPWAAFLGSRGEDLKARFRGTVARLLAERVLADPFRVVWFSGPGAPGSPVVVLSPSRRARAALDLLDAATRSGTVSFDHCPRPGAYAAATDAPPTPKITVARLLAADHAAYLGERDGRLAIGLVPAAAVYALCAELPAMPRPAGADLSLTVSRDALGREAQGLFALLGLGPHPRLEVAIEGEALVPRGLAGDLAAPRRLRLATLPRSMWKSVPEGSGVVLALALSLPADLGPVSLAAHLAGRGDGATAAREVLAVWNPRGDPAAPSEVALVWSEPGDAAALRALFSGPSTSVLGDACGHPVVASSAALAAQLRDSCSGRTPSLLAAPAPVVAAIGAPLSIGLGVNGGRILSRLAGDGYAADPANARPQGQAASPPEIESARRLLEELPFLWWSGVAKGSQLAPGGRS